jgi:hypothetical protein
VCACARSLAVLVVGPRGVGRGKRMGENAAAAVAPSRAAARPLKAGREGELDEPLQMSLVALVSQQKEWHELQFVMRWRDYGQGQNGSGTTRHVPGSAQECTPEDGP